ncbi:MAG: hypothetical protein MUD12_08985 [Spirochaetes bacterium]|jgi:hypothetical protein|nr:hypothetical protein [Spirochaetota bacterium]
MKRITIPALFIAVALVYPGGGISTAEKASEHKRTWEEFAKDCFVECGKIHKGGKYKVKGKTFKCDINMINELGNGGFGFPVEFSDICPKEYKKWDDDSIRKPGK